MKRSALRAVVTIMIAASLGACKSETSGLPSAQPGTTSTGSGGPFSATSPPGTSSTSTSAAPSPMAKISPCSLLTSSDLASLQVKGEGTEDKLDYSRACEYSYTTNTYLLGVSIFDELGLKDITGRDQLQQIKVGSHEAVQGVSPGGVCVIAMKITESSRVEAGVSAGAHEQQACDLALPAAKLVESKLPR